MRVLCNVVVAAVAAGSKTWPVGPGQREVDDVAWTRGSRRWREGRDERREVRVSCRHASDTATLIRPSLSRRETDGDGDVAPKHAACTINARPPCDADPGRSGDPPSWAHGRTSRFPADTTSAAYAEGGCASQAACGRQASGVTTVPSSSMVGARWSTVDTSPFGIPRLLEHTADATSPAPPCPPTQPHEDPRTACRVARKTATART